MDYHKITDELTQKERSVMKDHSSSVVETPDQVDFMGVQLG